MLEGRNIIPGTNSSTDDMVDAVVEANARDGSVDASRSTAIGFTGDADFEPRNGIEFESHEAAYSFYQEYAKSMGFTTSIKNSRRSKKSKEFIDAKFACSRYGVTPESDSGSSRRTSVKKTDCKASMHVKRRSDGKWIIHEFVKEHNHELLPALSYHFRIHRNVKLAEKNNMDILHAVSERTRKMYVEMSRQCCQHQNVGFSISDVSDQFDNHQQLQLDEGDAQIILEYFKRIKKENPDFFYAVDLNEELRLRNLFWVDAKSRTDYVSFGDVASFDTMHVKLNEKLAFAPFIGVNHHYQAMLLGCALIADDSKSTYLWVMKTWLRAMGGLAPKAIITDQDQALKAAVEEVLPETRHFFSLWHILEKIPEILSPVIKQHENFLPKFKKCIFKSWNDDQFDMRWWKMITRFELHNNEWVQALYEDRKKWVPTYMDGTFLAGMSISQRAESINAFFDKYIHKKISLREFVRQYGAILQNRYEEEAMADFDTCHKQPALRSPSPWEKQMSTVYTHAIFKKFQVEVLGVVGCQLKEQNEEEGIMTFKVQDCDKQEIFMVLWNRDKLEVSCICRSFEFNGFLCRHAMFVLQISGLKSIPNHYILKRWTKDAKSAQSTNREASRVQIRVQRYNDLCKHAIELSEEGSVSEESYNIAYRALFEALKSCVDVNNSKSIVLGSSSHTLRESEEEIQENLALKATRRKNVNKKRKGQTAPDLMFVETQNTLQQMESLGADGMTLNSYYGAQGNVQGLVQLNLMEPPHDGYYVNQQSMQGLGQLNAIAPGHDGFFGNQQSIHGLGQLDYRPSATFSYAFQGDPQLRSAQLEGNATRHH